MQRFLSAILGLPLLVNFAFAGPAPVEWIDLIDQSAQDFEDPFASIGRDAIEHLVKIVRIRATLDSMEAADPARTKLKAEELALTGAMTDQGHDVEWLISQRWIVAERRKKAAFAGNPQFDGQEIVIAGFAVPAPPAEDGTTVVYLVPERGMCSHMPPPPANQMIRARLPDGWSPSTMHEPLRLTGRLTISPSEHTFRIVDGLVPMNAAFQLDAKKVETLEDMRAETPQTNDWAADIAERLRASGALPAKEVDP